MGVTGSGQLPVIRSVGKLDLRQTEFQNPAPSRDWPKFSYLGNDSAVVDLA